MKRHAQDCYCKNKFVTVNDFYEVYVRWQLVHKMADQPADARNLYDFGMLRHFSIERHEFE